MTNRPSHGIHSRNKQQSLLGTRRQDHTKSSLEIYKYVLRLPLKELKHSNSKGHSHTKGTAKQSREEHIPTASVSAFLDRKPSVERQGKSSVVLMPPANNKSTELLCTDRFGEDTDRRFTLRKLCSQQLPTERTEQELNQLLKGLKYDKLEQLKQNITPTKSKNTLSVKLPELMCLIGDFIVERDRHQQLTKELAFYQQDCQPTGDSILKVLNRPK